MHIAGSTAGQTLRQPIIGIAPNPTGNGTGHRVRRRRVQLRRTISRLDGRTHLNRPIVGASAYGDGYLMLVADGGVFDFSNQPYPAARRAPREHTVRRHRRSHRLTSTIAPVSVPLRRIQTTDGVGAAGSNPRPPPVREGFFQLS